MRISLVGQKAFCYVKPFSRTLLEVEVLLAYFLGKNREYLLSHSEEEIGRADFLKFWKLIERLKNGEPVAYIINEKEFYGLDFFVDKRVLIPRPETEMIVEEAIKWAKKNWERGSLSILDVGTGSGNIAVALAKNIASVRKVDAIDIDENALKVAAKNVQKYGLQKIIKLKKSDLLNSFAEKQKYDIIVMNLPYIGKEQNNFVEEDVKKHEPNAALFSGKDGLALYKKIFQEIVEKRIFWRLIVGEFGFGQRKDMGKLLDKYFEHKWVIKKDLAGVDRVFVIKN